MNQNRIVTAAAAVVAAAGLAFGGMSLANADENTATSSPTTASTPGATGGTTGHGPGQMNGNTDPSKPMRSDEKLLTGDTLAKVTAAAKAKEPNATIQRVETDSEGVYEAHMVRADGTHITVQIGKDFTVTAVQQGGPNGSGGPGDHDGDRGHGPDGGQGADASSSTQTPSSGSTAANG